MQIASVGKKTFSIVVVCCGILVYTYFRQKTILPTTINESVAYTALIFLSLPFFYGDKSITNINATIGLLMVAVSKIFYMIFRVMILNNSFLTYKTILSIIYFAVFPLSVWALFKIWHALLINYLSSIVSNKPLAQSLFFVTVWFCAFCVVIIPKITFWVDYFTQIKNFTGSLLPPVSMLVSLFAVSAALWYVFLVLQLTFGSESKPDTHTPPPTK